MLKGHSRAKHKTLECPYFHSYFDSYANPINGATITVSGGFGASVSGLTGTNGYFAISITPTNVGGPYTLSYSVTSSYGNLNVNQNTLTVTAPIVVPTDKVLEGTTIAGQTGTMPNMSVRNPNGIGVGRSAALGYWTGGGSTVYLKPQTGYYDGVDTWTYFNDPNLVPSNIISGETILGVTGTAPTGKRWASGTAISSGYKITVTGLNFTPSVLLAKASNSTIPNYEIAVYKASIGGGTIATASNSGGNFVNVLSSSSIGAGSFTLGVNTWDGTLFEWLAIE